MEKGRQVHVEYTLYLDDGTQVDTNVGDDPLVYEAGAGQILPALEEALGAFSTGDEKRVTLAPDDAYGEADPEAFQTVPLDAVPEEAHEPGTPLVYEDDEGESHPIRVHEVTEDGIVLDLNHPLAGATLTFEVKIVAVQSGDDA